MVDDEESIRWSLRQSLSREGYEVAEASTVQDALRLTTQRPVDVVLLDLVLPGAEGIELLRRIKEEQPEVQVIVITAYASIGSAVEAVKLGAYDYVEKPFDIEELKLKVQRALESALLQREVDQFRGAQRRGFSPSQIVYQSPKMHALLEKAKRMGQSEVETILIEGESGTGKELLARAIHFWSRRREKPLIAVNAGAIPASLAEDEFFGHERGAFTDAKESTKGLLEQADGGTLFLDEISNMDLGIQAKLLRVIEEKRFRRLGGRRDVEVDVRIIAATNRSLQQLVKEGKFREDLYYRLAIGRLWIPPLREREEDIPILAEHFIGMFNRKYGKRVRGLSPEAIELLYRHPWPGNVRELRNVLEQVFILEDTEVIRPEHLRPLLQGDERHDSLQRMLQTIIQEGGSFEEAQRAFSRLLILEALKLAENNQSRAAALLGMNRSTLRYQMKRLGLL